MNETKPNEIISGFFKSTIGQMVSINDVDLLIELDEHKKGNTFLIKDKRVLTESGSTYYLLTLDHVGTDLEYLLVCSTFKGACDIMLFKQPDFFQADKRSVIQESSNDWLFDFEGYPQEIYNGEIVYTKKFQQETFGKTALIEWETQSEIVDYKLILIETGIFHEGGGWVEFYAGRQIQDKDVIL